MARTSASRGKSNVGSAIAAVALSTFMTGAGSSRSPARAAIAPAGLTGVVHTYHIPPSPMTGALNALADQNGLHLSYDARMTRGIRSPGLSGNYSVRDALEKLLAGTGLGYRLSASSGAVAIMLAQNDTGTQTDANGITLPTVDVTANQQGAGGGSGGTGCGEYGGAPCSGFGGAGLAQDPFNTTYVLPDASVGTKTDTPIMDTPLNVQVVPQQVLRDQQAITIDQALQNVSGVTVGHGAADNGNPFDSIMLRGFPTFNYYRDGFRVDAGATSLSSTAQLANVASVEVLKGPAAILYGLSEPGGLVNIVTKDPLNAPYYAVSQQIGSLALYRTTLDATGPLTDDKSWLYRMNMSYENNGAPFGSFVDFTNQQTLFFAPVVKWNIDGATSVKLEAQYNNTRTSSFFPSDPVYDGYLVPIPRNRNYAESSPVYERTLFLALTWSHQFDKDWSIKQQIAYNRGDVDSIQHTQYTYFIDTSGPVPVFDRSLAQNFYGQTTYSTNVNITGHIDTFGALHTLLLGGDFYKFNQYSQYTLAPLPAANSPIDVWNPIHPGLPFIGPLLPGGEFFTPQDTAGLYLQDQVKLPYNFFAMAGARFQYVRENGGLSGYPTFGTNPTINNAQTQQALTPRFGLLWRPQDWVSFYTSYTEGFGANAGLIYPGKAVPATSATDIEGGIKLELLGGKLRATADYYELTKTNVPSVDPFHLPLGMYSLVTGAERSKGPELDIQGELLPGWNVIVAYTNQDVRIVSTYPGDITGAAGQRVAATPQNLGTFWTTYEFQPDTALKGLKIGGGVIYHGSQLPEDFSGQNLSPRLPLVSGYATINLMAAYSFNVADTKMTAQVNVTNLLDHTFYTDAAYFAPYAPGVQAGERVYGAPFSIVGSLRAQIPPKAPAIAAGLTPPPSPAPLFTWTGVYVGAQIGYAWGDNAASAVFATPGDLNGAIAVTGAAQGIIGGAHIGYNYEVNQWVVGLEGTVDGTNLNKNVLRSYADPVNTAFGATLNGTLKSSIQGSIRGRVGYAWDRLLIYGTGGVALAGFNSELNFSGTDAIGSFLASDSGEATRTGWTAGGGVEYAINDNWSVRGEYRYSDVGHLIDTPAFPVAGLSYTANRHLAQNQVEADFSYKFNTSVPAPVVAKY
jgi:iron complex outermembrane receptor protein